MLNKLLEKMTESYNKNNFSDIIDYLDENCVYSSQWVIDEICGNGAVAAYFESKTRAIAAAGSQPEARIVNLTSPVTGRAIMLSQSGKDVVVMLREKDGRICGIELCMPSLFEFEEIGE